MLEKSNNYETTRIFNPFFLSKAVYGLSDYNVLLCGGTLKHLKSMLIRVCRSTLQFTRYVHVPLDPIPSSACVLSTLIEIVLLTPL
jgi:hypothetical protein